MAIAGAAFGAGKALEDIIGEQMLRAQMQAREQEAAARTELERARLSESMRQNDLNEKFRGRQEDRVLAGDRQKTNEREVRRMIGEGITRRVPLDDMQGMAFAEGIDLPQEAKPERVQYTYTDPKTGNKSLRFANKDQVPEGGLDLGNEPQKPEKGPAPDYEWVVGKDGQPKQIRKGSAQPGDRPYDAAAERKKPDANGPSPYAAERAKRTVDAVDRIIGKVGLLTAGPGSMLSMIPGTDSRDFEAELNTLKSNIAFNELAAMREASKTGGALGAVSDREMTLLQSVLGGLDSGQSPSALRTQLQQVKDSVQRWQAAEGLQGGATGLGVTATMPDTATAAAQALIEKARAQRKPQ